MRRRRIRDNQKPVFCCIRITWYGSSWHQANMYHTNPARLSHFKKPHRPTLPNISSDRQSSFSHQSVSPHKQTPQNASVYRLYEPRLWHTSIWRCRPHTYQTMVMHPCSTCSNRPHHPLPTPMATSRLHFESSRPIALVLSRQTPLI